MSIQARQQIVNSPNTFFKSPSQRADFLDPNKVHTEAIAQVLYLVNKGHIIEFTSVCSDHGPDGCLGPHSHQCGRAFDCWPLKSRNPGDYIEAGGLEMRQFLTDIAASSWTWNIGLGGSADIAPNRVAAGPKVFSDNGSDHIHVACDFNPLALIGVHK